MMRLLISLLAGLLLAAGAHAEMPRLELRYGMYRIDAEVAHTTANLQQGLMQRREMPAHRGMLFVFERDFAHCMWMRNTFIPLSVAFLDREGRVINVADMTPQDETPHCASRPARYALEMNRGWFDARGVKAGARIVGVERAPPFAR
jgi:hypothetical protein